MKVTFPPELSFLSEPHRYKVLYGGRGGIKSWSVAQHLLIAGVERPLRIPCARETMQSIRESVHQLLEDQISRLGYQRLYEVQKAEIIGRNGTSFTFFTASATSRFITSSRWKVPIFSGFKRPRTSARSRNDFLAAFAEIIDASAAAIALEDRQLRWSRLYLTHGMDRETIDSYSHYYVSLNPWALLRTPTVGEIRTGEEVLSEAELRDTEFYHGWFKPRGWLNSFSVIFETSETERTYLFSIRPPSHPFTEKELAILKEIAPHLAKAAGMARRNIASHEIDQHRSGALEMDALTSLNLSRAESRIALALSHGQSVKEYAYSAGLTADTVRWHVKRIYKKLGVHHRDDFKRLLLDISRQ